LSESNRGTAASTGAAVRSGVAAGVSALMVNSRGSCGVSSVITSECLVGCSRKKDADCSRGNNLRSQVAVAQAQMTATTSTKHFLRVHHWLRCFCRCDLRFHASIIARSAPTHDSLAALLSTQTTLITFEWTYYSPCSETSFGSRTRAIPCSSTKKCTTKLGLKP
jgi:hypothetical protein